MAFKYFISFATDLAANFGWNQFRIIPDIVSKHLCTAIRSHCAVQMESEQTLFPWTGHILFATNWAANFGCYWFRIMPDIVSKHLCTPIRSCCPVLLESEQTPFPWKGRRLGSAALNRIQFGTCSLFLCYIFTQRPMNDCKIEQSYRHCFGQQQLLANSIENFISHEKKKLLVGVVAAQYLQSIKTFLTVELSQYSKSGSTFSSSEPVAVSSNCSRIANVMCLCTPFQPTKAVPQLGPKSLAIDFAVKSFDCLLE